MHATLIMPFSDICANWRRHCLGYQPIEIRPLTRHGDLPCSVSCRRPSWGAGRDVAPHFDDTIQWDARGAGITVRPTRCASRCADRRQRMPGNLAHIRVEACLGDVDMMFVPGTRNRPRGKRPRTKTCVPCPPKLAQRFRHSSAGICGSAYPSSSGQKRSM
jgi:hypothetical protein